MSHASWGLPERAPVVAGLFYPAEPSVIARTLDHWNEGVDDTRQPWRAALIPHAGWVYSGRIAAAVMRRIIMPKSIIVLCPKHRGGGVECAVAPWQRWLFPGGSISTDETLSQRLVEAVPQWELDDRPHRQEHAIEVQLPLLARYAPESEIVAITIGRVDLQQCQAMAQGLSEVLRDRLDDVLLVVSSDMNHFASDKENRRLDELALQAVDRLDPVRLYETCHAHRITMCGMLPTVIVLTALQHLNSLHRSVRVAYATSAEASGDTERVVGYAGLLFD